METIFDEKIKIEYHKHFDDPFNTDKTKNKTVCHFVTAYFLFNNRISPSKQLIIKDNIDCLYYIYVDHGNSRWDDKYWFCIGKTKDARFFSYESTCGGTGFGLGSQTKIYYAMDQEILLTYGIEDKHRTFMKEHTKMFLHNLIDETLCTFPVT